LGLWCLIVKRDVADTAFSNFIRERDDFTCQRCRKFYPEGRRQGLHCSHFFSRRHQATRFYSGNAAAHCFSCHQYLGGNPIEFSEWINDHIGDEAFAELRAKKEKIKKRTKREKKEIAAHWRAQLKYLRRCRDEERQFCVMEWD
jgi:hypothetical protein